MEESAKREGVLLSQVKINFTLIHKQRALSLFVL